MSWGCNPGMEKTVDDRRQWMGVLARAQPAAFAALIAQAGITDAHELLRPPEAGLIMVRGRMGGDGAPFNLGEMSVTRCSVVVASGAVGHGMVAGRDASHARNAAFIDALMTDEARRGELMRLIIAPLAETEASAADARARESAATKVDFFTVARGEDAA